MKRLAPIVLWLIAWSSARGDTAPSLEQRLKAEGHAALAEAARELGDPRRGAVLFFQPQLGCSKCHGDGVAKPTLGPDLGRLAEPVPAPAHLVESILDPSKFVEKGYQTITIASEDGKTWTGLLAEDQPDAVLLRDPAADGQLVRVPKDQIAERRVGGASLMPSGLVNALSTRQEFLDLVRYVTDVAAGGPARALDLRPPPEALAPPPLPEYEKRLDHAGLIASWDDDSLERGESIYERVCANCHGTIDRPGSLPTSLRFASGTFKNGSAPWQIYQTLTRGYGMMAPQTWMVPQQKYDVIHYIREKYIKPHNLTQYVAVNDKYLAGLPKGASLGPKPIERRPWADMDYGPSLTATYEIPGLRESPKFAYKGIAVRLDDGPGGVSRGRAWVMFDHDTLRLATAWTGAFIDWAGINFDGRHEVHPRVIGAQVVTNPAGPGWADPRKGRLTFDDARLRGRDGLPYGPLPRDWAHLTGMYHHGKQTILSYRVGKADILETTTVASQDVFARTLEVGRAPHDLLLRVADDNAAVARIGGDGSILERAEGAHNLRIPAAASPLRVTLVMGPRDQPLPQVGPPEALEPLTHGGPRHWPEALRTPILVGLDEGPFAFDELSLPDDNPWACRFRPTGFDFLERGAAAVCTWDGDVWRVDGLQQAHGSLTWRRIASGLFQPLGLKVHGGQTYVACRDQIVVLHDLNGDQEIDFYENFNNDHQVTEHFHEFAMDLQTDPEGNFYYAKAARHGKTALVPHHGTLLRVSKDGLGTEILATGFRAPNGVCLNGDGTFFLSDQEGYWLPKNRINWVKPGRYYGNLWGFTDVTDPADDAMEPPVCWITNRFDRSPAELLWVDSPKWGPLRGSLLNLSYGYGKIYTVPHEKVDGLMQGGMAALPIPQFATGVMRGRFRPDDGHLYVCGMFAWAGNQERPGGFYRVRATGKPIHSPVGIKAKREGMQITFTEPLDRTVAADPTHYAVTTWSLKRSELYGSEHYDEKALRVSAVDVSDDGRTVFLKMPEIRPTWCMAIKYSLRSSEGMAFEGEIHNTVHRLP
jgi:putative heme-binding domain-containing protein